MSQNLHYFQCRFFIFSKNPCQNRQKSDVNFVKIQTACYHIQYFMKYYLLLKLCFFALLSNVVCANHNTTPLDYIQAMQQAHRQLNYEQFYILQQGDNVESLRYRHANWLGKEYAQLLELDYSREEIILRDNMIGYFGEFQPFSLSGPHIVDNLPTVLYTNFHQLQGYHFIDSGKMRIADSLARIIRIIPQDDFRYQYELWIDEESHLLLRSDILDRERNILEQFRVIQHTVDDELLRIVEPINTLIFPTLIPAKEATITSASWKLDWLPSGFKPIPQSYQRFPLFDDEQIESQRYSDGLFSFTIYFA